MRRAVISFFIALMLGVPAISHAQYSDMDRQNPKEYTDDDSHPLKIASYLIAPVGFALEWGVARPLYYLANDTFLAPVLSGDIAGEQTSVPRIVEVPPDVMPEEPAHLAPSEASPQGAVSPMAPKSAGQAGSSSKQSVLH